MLSRLKVPIALTLAVAAIGVLVAAGVSRNDAYMATLDQWSPERAGRETVRLMGFVAEGSIDEERERLVTRFELRNDDGSRTLPVVFEGVTPDLFRDGASLVVTGRLEAGGTFRASDLMTKCPSKYEGAEDAPGMPHGLPGPEGSAALGTSTDAGLPG